MSLRQDFLDCPCCRAKRPPDFLEIFLRPHTYHRRRPRVPNISGPKRDPASLPPELFDRILRFCDLEDVGSMRQVSRSWCAALYQPFLVLLSRGLPEDGLFPEKHTLAVGDKQVPARDLMARKLFKLVNSRKEVVNEVVSLSMFDPMPHVLWGWKLDAPHRLLMIQTGSWFRGGIGSRRVFQRLSQVDFFMAEMSNTATTAKIFSWLWQAGAPLSQVCLRLDAKAYSTPGADLFSLLTKDDMKFADARRAFNNIDDLSLQFAPNPADHEEPEEHEFDVLRLTPNLTDLGISYSESEARCDDMFYSLSLLDTFIDFMESNMAPSVPDNAVLGRLESLTLSHVLVQDLLERLVPLLNAIDTFRDLRLDHVWAHTGLAEHWQGIPPVSIWVQLLSGLRSLSLKSFRCSMLFTRFSGNEPADDDIIPNPLLTRGYYWESENERGSMENALPELENLLQVSASQDYYDDGSDD